MGSEVTVVLLSRIGSEVTVVLLSWMGSEVTVVLLSRMGSDVIITGEHVIKAVSPSISTDPLPMLKVPPR